MSAKTLLEVHLQRLAEHETGMCKGQESNYRKVVRYFGNYLGHEATIEDLTPGSFNGFVDSLRESKKLSTVRSYRAFLKTLWTFAFEEGWVEAPRKLRKIQCKPTSPIALTQEEVARIVETALGYGDKFKAYPQRVYDFIGECLKKRMSPANIALALNDAGYKTFERKKFVEVTVIRLINEMTGKTNPPRLWSTLRIPASVYLSSLICAAWDSGLRMGDLFAFRKDWLIRQPTGGATFEIVMRKTGYSVAGFLKPGTLDLIDQCLGHGDVDRELIWPCQCRRRFGLIWNVLFDDAGITGKKKFKHIRSGSASAAELLRFGAGTELLGHRNRQVTVQHYIDPKIVRREAIVLPSVVPASAKTSVTA